MTSIVAEMTGYPADLLDPDLDLEADLGVDTVKQAEVFAAVRARWDLERDDSLQLREFPTLNHVAGWVRVKLGTAAPATAAAAGQAAPGATSARPAAPVTVVGDLDAVDALPRRVPTPSLRPAADRCLPTGISLAGARVVVMRDEAGVGDALVKRLTQGRRHPARRSTPAPPPTRCSRSYRVDGRGPRRGRLLARRARRRG